MGGREGGEETRKREEGVDERETGGGGNGSDGDREGVPAPWPGCLASSCDSGVRQTRG